MKSKVFKFAHRVRKNFNNWSEALKFAWKKIKLQMRLNNKLCYFQFKKKSTGELRDALGTTNIGFINYEFKGYPNDKWYIIRFWETNKSQWRSLDVRTLVKIYW
jgi:hypothetical protein